MYEESFVIYGYVTREVRKILSLNSEGGQTECVLLSPGLGKKDRWNSPKSDEETGPIHRLFLREKLFWVKIGMESMP